MEILLIGIGMFIAGFIDSIAGGGGLISTPTLLLVGLPPHLALGTNKLAAAAGTLVPSSSFGETGGTWPLAAAAMHALGQDFIHAVAEAQHPQTEPRRQQPQLPVERIC